MSETVAKGKRTWLYTFARGLVWLMGHTLFPIKCVNTAQLSSIEAPYIIIANHDSALDPLALAYIVKHYEIRFIAKKELMKGRFTKWLLGKRLHTIPVDRHQSDMMAMRNAVKSLKEGHVLGIFPEGTRHKQGLMDDLEGGTALLALRGNVPIVPVYITPKLRFLRLTQVIVGNPIDVSDLANKGIDKTVCDELLSRIADVYAAMAKANLNL